MGLLASLAYCLASPDSMLVTPSAWARVTPAMAAMYTGLSVSGLLAFTTHTRSLQLACPSLVSSLGAIELVAAFIVQSLITGQIPDTLTSIGGGLIVTGVIILACQAGSIMISSSYDVHSHYYRTKLCVYKIDFKHLLHRIGEISIRRDSHC